MERRKNNEKYVALISPDAYAGISTPVINTALFLAEVGYQIDLYVGQDDFCDKLGLELKKFDTDKINIHYYKPRWSRIFTRIISISIDVEFCLLNIFNGRKYSFIIGFDPRGVIRAAILAAIWRVPYLYHSLEFYENHDLIKILERLFAQKALYVLTQDQQRRKILSKTLGLPKEKFLISTNSSMGSCITEKKDYFRKMFSIPKSKYIVLYTGSILVECYAEEVTLAALKWPKEFVLVIHGWIPDERLRQLIKKIVAKNPEKIYLSTNILPFEKKYDIFQSVDIGLVLFKPSNFNFKYAAGSAGKLYDFMRVGVPMIANCIPGMKKLIQNNQIGEVVKDIQSIEGALENIISRYDLYKNNCFKQYCEYDFAISYSEILKNIERNLKI